MMGCRVAAVAAGVTLLAAASAQASVEVITFDDGVVGSTYPFAGEAPGFYSAGIVATDGSNKYLRLNNEDVWVWPGSVAKGPDGVRTAHQGVVMSFDVFLIGHSIFYEHGRSYDVPTDSWQHVVVSNPSDFGTYFSILGDGYVDNITYDDVTSSRFVPEPGTWALMILGFGMIGSAARRRRALTAT